MPWIFVSDNDDAKGCLSCLGLLILVGALAFGVWLGVNVFASQPPAPAATRDLPRFVPPPPQDAGKAPAARP